MSFSIYKNKKVLITGHTGFKGSWLSIWLKELGASVSGYALDPRTENDNFVLSRIGDKINDVRGDILDREKLFGVFQSEQPEIVFHLAAQPLVLDSYSLPVETISTNTLGTAHVLDAFNKSASAKLLLIITTDKVYDNVEWEWGYRENDRLGGKDIYSASKAAAEIIADAFRHSFLLDTDKLVVTVRAGNVIGGGDWSPNRIIPDCIRAIEQKLPVIIRNPLSIRPWQHVLEPLAGYLLLGEKLLSGEHHLSGAWNFGPLPGNILCVENLVKEIISSYGNGEYLIQKNMNALYESNILTLDISKAMRKLNWSPKLDIHETIIYTVDWYKNYTQANVYNLCVEQINKYMDL